MSKSGGSLYPWTLVQNHILEFQSWLSFTQIKKGAYDCWSPIDRFDGNYKLHLGLYLRDLEKGREEGRTKRGRESLRIHANKHCEPVLFFLLSQQLVLMFRGHSTCHMHVTRDGRGEADGAGERRLDYTSVCETETGPDDPPGTHHTGASNWESRCSLILPGGTGRDEPQMFRSMNFAICKYSLFFHLV